VDATERERLAEFLIRCGVTPRRAADLSALERLYRDLVAANEATNLTAVTAEGDYWHLHVADSLAVGLAVPELLAGPVTAADVGCGAGFPMLPLAWANGELRVTGIESRGRKADFVRRQIAAMGLPHAAVVTGRAREVARMPDHAGQYQAVLLRAVGPPGKLIRECRGLLAPAAGAKLIFYTTPAAAAEQHAEAAREAAKFGLSLRESQTISLPAGSGDRQFLIAERTIP
jgi:16S rRNA (guanine527-N7)-methyltransferase